MMQPETMRSYFHAGSTRDMDLRIAYLKKLKTSLETYRDEINRALYEDLGKPEFEAFAVEVAPVIKEIESLAKHLKHWLKTETVRSPLLFYRGKTRILHEPHGLVLIISPWNYPFLLTMMPLVAAIACGNVVLAKHSRRSPATGAIIQKIISRVFPPEWVTVTDKVDLEEPYDYLFFTGGVTAGHTIYQTVAKYGTPATLELGGKNPVVVDKTVELPTAAARIAWAKCMNAGQTCVAPDHILLYKPLLDAFVKEIGKAIISYYGENPGNNEDYPKIISDTEFERLEQYCPSEKILLRCGNHNPDTRRFAPTIITANETDPVMQREIFGPVLPILTWETDEELNRLISTTPLALYIFSNDDVFAEQLIRKHPSGGICRNDTMLQAANPNAPFGGVGTSGFGNYHGINSIGTFSRKRTLVLRKERPELTIRYPPYTKKKTEILYRWRKYLF